MAWCLALSFKLTQDAKSLVACRSGVLTGLSTDPELLAKQSASRFKAYEYDSLCLTPGLYSHSLRHMQWCASYTNQGSSLLDPRPVDIRRHIHIEASQGPCVSTSTGLGSSLVKSLVHGTSASPPSPPLSNLTPDPPRWETSTHSNGSGISSSCACVWLFATLHHN